MYHVYIWTLVFVSGLISPRLAVATTTHRPTTTPSIPTGSCVVDGKIYADGEEIVRDVNNCNGTICYDGQVIYYDHQCFLDPPVCPGNEIQVPGECCKKCITTIPTTIPTTTIPTTTPDLPDGTGCDYNGKIFKNGDDIERYPCARMLCQNGGVLAWDYLCLKECNNGTLIPVEYQCCPLCVQVTTVMPPETKTTIPITTIPTTTTHLPPGACEHDGRIFMNGDDIERSPCNGLKCQDGQVIAWDDKCAFYTSECNGTLIPVEGQCCPLCIQVTTVMPPETTTTIPVTTIPTTTAHLPPGACEHDGRIFMNGDHIERSPCNGLLCQDGQVIAWDDKCAFYTPECNGTLIPVEGQCCPLCIQVTTVIPPETTTTMTTTIKNNTMFDGRNSASTIENLQLFCVVYILPSLILTKLF